MQIVIKISEDTYKDIVKNGFIYDEDNEVVTHAIKNGTPLPKGHDKLIDSKILKGHIDRLPCLPDGNFAGNHSALKALINMQPTIIEADKTEIEPQERSDKE